MIIEKQNHDRKIVEEEKIKKYNYDDLFKKNNINKLEINKENTNSSNKEMIVYKENFVTKIINKIKKFLNKK